jgi:cytochrome c-type biogenesis protein
VGRRALLQQRARHPHRDRPVQLPLAAALPFGLAFGAGMVAAVNPCGFAMLPAYLSLYLGAEEEGFAERSAVRRALRALLVGLTVSMGFVAVIALAGAVISAGGTVLIGALPVLGVLVGEALIVIGLWLFLGGRSPYVGVLFRLAVHLGDPRRVGVRGFSFFGLAYGTVSLGCTLPALLAAVGSGINAGSVATGALRFVSYALGMASFMVTLTLSLAFFKKGVLKPLRGVMPYVRQVSAVLLVLAGA